MILLYYTLILIAFCDYYPDWFTKTCHLLPFYHILACVLSHIPIASNPYFSHSYQLNPSPYIIITWSTIAVQFTKFFCKFLLSQKLFHQILVNFLLHFLPICNIFPLPKLQLLCIFGLVISLRIKEYITIWATDGWSKSYSQKSDSWKYCQQPIILFFSEISMHNANFLKSFRTVGMWMIVNRLCPFSSSFASVFLHFRHFATTFGNCKFANKSKTSPDTSCNSSSKHESTHMSHSHTYDKPY